MCALVLERPHCPRLHLERHFINESGLLVFALAHLNHTIAHLQLVLHLVLILHGYQLQLGRFLSDLLVWFEGDEDLVVLPLVELVVNLVQVKGTISFACIF